MPASKCVKEASGTACHCLIEYSGRRRSCLCGAAGRRSAASRCGHRRSAWLARAGWPNVDIFERVGILLKLRLHLDHNMVLVRLREDRRDLPLAEGIIKRIVNHLRRDAETVKPCRDQSRASPASPDSVDRSPRRAVAGAFAASGQSAATRS